MLAASSQKHTLPPRKHPTSLRIRQSHQPLLHLSFRRQEVSEGSVGGATLNSRGGRSGLQKRLHFNPCLAKDRPECALGEIPAVMRDGDLSPCLRGGPDLVTPG